MTFLQLKIPSITEQISRAAPPCQEIKNATGLAYRCLRMVGMSVWFSAPVMQYPLVKDPLKAGSSPNLEFKPRLRILRSE